MHRVISFTVAVILSTCSALSLLSVSVGALTTTADAIIQSARVYETDVTRWVGGAHAVTT